MKRLLSALVLAALLLTPVAALAQDGPKMETFTSEDELLTLRYPEGWITNVDEETPFPSVVIINSEDGLARIEADEDPVSGDAVIMVAVFPFQFLTLLQVDVPAGATAVDLATAFLPLFTEPDPEDDVDPESIEAGEVEEIELGDDLVAGYVTVRDNVSDGAYIVRPLDEDFSLILITFVAAYPGEFTDDLAALGRAVSTSVAYTGTADDIMAAVMAGDESGTGEEVLDGATLVAERCTVCHTIDRIDAKDADEAGWTATVDRMIGNGAQLTADERQALIAYLVETH